MKGSSATSVLGSISLWLFHDNKNEENKGILVTTVKNKRRDKRRKYCPLNKYLFKKSKTLQQGTSRSYSFKNQHQPPLLWVTDTVIQAERWCYRSFLGHWGFGPHLLFLTTTTKKIKHQIFYFLSVKVPHIRALLEPIRESFFLLDKRMKYFWLQMEKWTF